MSMQIILLKKCQCSWIHRHTTSQAQFTGTPLKLKETNTSTKHKMLKNTTGEMRTRWLYIRNMTDELNYCRVCAEKQLQLSGQSKT